MVRAEVTPSAGQKAKSSLRHLMITFKTTERQARRVLTRTRWTPRQKISRLVTSSSLHTIPLFGGRAVTQSLPFIYLMYGVAARVWGPAGGNSFVSAWNSTPSGVEWSFLRIIFYVRFRISTRQTALRSVAIVVIDDTTSNAPGWTDISWMPTARSDATEDENLQDPEVLRSRNVQGHRKVR